jgi:hypothetical protein
MRDNERVLASLAEAQYNLGVGQRSSGRTSFESMERLASPGPYNLEQVVGLLGAAQCIGPVRIGLQPIALGSGEQPEDMMDARPCSWLAAPPGGGTGSARHPPQACQVACHPVCSRRQRQYSNLVERVLPL